jgi:hypothetical protein
MPSSNRLVPLAVAVALALTIAAAPAQAAADPNVLCHKTVVKQLEKYKKTHLKLYRNCIDKQNRNLIPGPCLDATSDAKLGLANQKVSAAIAKKCTMGNLAVLGYRSDCQYGPATAGVGGTCFALPVTTATEFAECMKCWKGAEFSRYVGTLYASHAQEVCGTALDDTSATCSAVGCASPTPEQRDLGDNAENDCQRMLSKAGLNYLLKREKILDRCMLRGLTYPACLADPKTQLQLAKAETQKQTLILKKCTNYEPVANAPFCCRTGQGQTCSAAIDRNDCTTNLAGTIQEGKFCGSLSCNGGTNDGVSCAVDSECPGGACNGSCANSPGPGKALTWWEHCPNNEPCPGPTLGDIDGVIQCVDDVADELVGNVLCLQFPNGGACPTPAAPPTPTVTPTP